MIKLTNAITVACDQITRIEVNDYGVLVFTKDGSCHHVDRDYNKTAYDLQERLVDEINQACAPEVKPC